MKFVFLFLIPLSFLSAQGASESLFSDLERLDEINKKVYDALPLPVNYLLQGGYFTMPSARTYKAGLVSFQFSYSPPYRMWNLGLQFFNRIETTGNYWIYQGMIDQNFGSQGFGEIAERAANAKFILLRPEDGIEILPDFAFGWNDFMGTQGFHSFYAVATKEWLDANLEATFGWGKGRIHGFFGGVAWSPWRHSKYFWKGLMGVAEYDANDYEHHDKEHAHGRVVSNRINAGVQLRLFDLFQLSFSSLRGEEWAGSIAMQYNLGKTKGLYPKFLDPKPYKSPVDTEPLGLQREDLVFAQELAYAFKEQGFDLYTLRRVPREGGRDHLWLKLMNVRYWEEEKVRKRVESVLSALQPSNIDVSTVVIEVEGIPVHEYNFRRADLTRYRAGRLGEKEFSVIAPMAEVKAPPGKYDSSLLYQRKKPIWILTFRPWAKTFFGSSTGKFKYEVGLALGPEGYLFDEIYYNLQGSYTIQSSVQNMKDCDVLNPSKLINVRTDTIRYNQANSFHIDNAYLQKSWNLGRGLFSRLAVGYFEMAYAGVAVESLYFPVQQNWAIGAEVATVLKRSYSGMGFQHKVRKITSEGCKYFPYVGLQYFVDFYYEYKPLSLDFKTMVGQFLARDKGIRMEFGRTFDSGIRFGLWYAFTNGNDVINAKRYYDKGFSVSMPLDIFLNQSSRTRIGYSMAAWLRDIDAVAMTGRQLYPTIYWERYQSHAQTK